MKIGEGKEKLSEKISPSPPQTPPQPHQRFSYGSVSVLGAAQSRSEADVSRSCGNKADGLEWTNADGMF